MNAINVVDFYNARQPKGNNITLTWRAFVNRLSAPKINNVTAQDFKNLPAEEKLRLKDVGGFIGAVSLDGGRKKTSIEQRSLITLDYDHLKDLEAFKERVRAVLGRFTYCFYSTHTHTPEEPRIRLVIPFAAPESLDNYYSMAHYIADGLNIEGLDSTTFDHNRIMFYPAIPKDVEYVFEDNDGFFMEYRFCRRGIEAKRKELLEKALEQPAYNSQAQKYQPYRRPQNQNNNKNAPYIVRAFNAFATPDFWLDSVLRDMYSYEENLSQQGQKRYTYIGASTKGGLTVFEDHVFSFHDSDPLPKYALKPFDMLRLALFGDLDKGTPNTAKETAKPSFRAMEAWIKENYRQIWRDSLALERKEKGM